MSDPREPLPADVFLRMLSGEITPRQAQEEAAAVAPGRQAFNAHLRSMMGSRQVEQRDRLRARLFAEPDRARDEQGRFAPRPSDADAAPSSPFDGGPRGSKPEPRTDNEKVSDAILTLQDLRGA